MSKNFAVPENQRVWEIYYNNAVSCVPTEDVEAMAKKKTSLAQYACSLRAFENTVGKPFDCITVEDMEAFAEQTGKKGKFAHVSGFLLTCLTNGWVKSLDKEFLIYLLPDAYKALGRMIAEIQ